MRKLKELGLVIASLLVSLFIAELVLQNFSFFGLRSGTYTPISQENRINELVSLFEPNYNGRLTSRDFDVSVRSNSIGFREREISFTDIASENPLFFVGDSYFFGHGVEVGDRFTELLATKIGNTSLEKPIVNFAFPGFGPPQYIEIISLFSQQLKPSLIVVGFFIGNDFQRDDIAAEQHEVERSESGSPDSSRVLRGKLRGALKNSSTVNLIKYSLWNFAWFRSMFNSAEIRNDRIDMYCNTDSVHAKQLYASTYRFLDKLKLLSTDFSVPVVLVIVPDHLQIIDLEVFDECDSLAPQTLITQHSESIGLNYLDLLPAFNNENEPSALFFREDKHWTPLGHEVASQAILEYLLKNQTSKLQPSL